MSRRIILTRSNLQTIADKVKAEITGPLVNTFFPVGSVYITSKSPNDGGDPNVLFPGTRWTRLEDAYLCATASSADAANATPHGSNTRSASELPGHIHPTITTGNNSNYATNRSSVDYILYKGDETLDIQSPFIEDWNSGSWYGTPYNNNNQTKFFQLNINLPNHTHTVANVMLEDTSVVDMNIQPKTLYKYGWERTA
jgi:hypothetical protein